MKVLLKEISVMCKEWMDHVVGVIFDLCLLLLLLEMSNGLPSIPNIQAWMVCQQGRIVQSQTLVDPVKQA
jgi:hypothetical protein